MPLCSNRSAAMSRAMSSVAEGRAASSAFALIMASRSVSFSHELTVSAMPAGSPS